MQMTEEETSTTEDEDDAFIDPYNCSSVGASAGVVGPFLSQLQVQKSRFKGCNSLEIVEDLGVDSPICFTIS